MYVVSVFVRSLWVFVNGEGKTERVLSLLRLKRVLFGWACLSFFLVADVAPGVGVGETAPVPAGARVFVVEMSFAFVSINASRPPVARVLRMSISSVFTALSFSTFSGRPSFGWFSGHFAVS